MGKGDLEVLYEKIKDCKRCPLHKTRTNFVFGEGPEFSRLVYVGEAPGKEEDILGFPFVGAAGKLLERILESIGFKREEVYITNILKCRPPNNRNPLPQEIKECEPYLREQLKIIRPKIICALGTYAAQTLLKTKTSISKLRGKIFYYQDIMVIPTYHPAALLRNPQWKRAVWEDMKMVKSEYDKI